MELERAGADHGQQGESRAWRGSILIHRNRIPAPIDHRTHPPPQPSTAAPIYRPTYLSLVSRSQAHLANVLDNGRSGKEVALTSGIAGGSVASSRRHLVAMNGILRLVGRECAKKGGYGNCGIATQEKMACSELTC
jgi:hypothetical protein